MTSNRKLEAMDAEDVIRYIKEGNADVPREDGDGLDGWRALYRHYYGDEGMLARLDGCTCTPIRGSHKSSCAWAMR